MCKIKEIFVHAAAGFDEICKYDKEVNFKILTFSNKNV